MTPLSIRHVAAGCAVVAVGALGGVGAGCGSGDVKHAQDNIDSVKSQAEQTKSDLEKTKTDVQNQVDDHLDEAQKKADEIQSTSRTRAGATDGESSRPSFPAASVGYHRSRCTALAPER